MEHQMRIMLLVASIAFNLLAVIPRAAADEPRQLKMASEVRIEQSHGSIPANTNEGGGKTKRAVPEGSSTSGNASSGSPGTPLTCNQQNASSPACYSATQQARPVSK
jgi:hypothetical protein